MPFNSILRRLGICILIAAALLSTISLSTPFSFTGASSGGGPCYGAPENCLRPYHHLTYLASHNSYSTGASIAANQHWDVATQMDAGVRGIFYDIYKKDGAMRLCHGDCMNLDAGLHKDGLKTIVAWLQRNPNEVVTMIYENTGKFTPAEIAAEYKEVGADALAFSKPPDAPWPTLADMIKSGKRLVVFSSPLVPDPSIAWVMDEFRWMWETPFDPPTTLDAFSCVMDRPKKPLQVPQANILYGMNHFTAADPLGGLLNSFMGNQTIDLPSAELSAQVNTIESLQKHINICVGMQKRRPTFVILDFVDLGAGRDAVMRLNAQNVGDWEAKDPVGANQALPPLPASTTPGQSSVPSANGSPGVNATVNATSTPSPAPGPAAQNTVEQTIKDSTAKSSRFGVNFSFSGAGETLLVSPSASSGSWLALVVGVLALTVM